MGAGGRVNILRVRAGENFCGAGGRLRLLRVRLGGWVRFLRVRVEMTRLTAEPPYSSYDIQYLFAQKESNLQPVEVRN